jgi:lipoyl(octanoyl) transferase
VSTNDILNACALGATSYRDGLALQSALVDARAAGRTGDWLLFPDHPPVLTVGRGGSEGLGRTPRSAIEARGLEIFEVSRGGDVTWHGPGQLVGYLIVGLDRCGRDLHRYLRGIEDALIDTLARWELRGERVAGRTGVWVEGEKIASIGVAVRRWVGYHGFALNVEPDLSNFDLIHPCGLPGIHMTSLARRLGPRAPSLAAVRERTAAAMAARMGFERVVWADRSALPGIQPSSTADETTGAITPC